MIGVKGMSKPTLGQIVEVAKQQGHFIGIVKDREFHFVKCEDAVEKFGDVEIKDLSFDISAVVLSKPCNQFKSTIKVFI